MSGCSRSYPAPDMLARASRPGLHRVPHQVPHQAYRHRRPQWRRPTGTKVGTMAQLRSSGSFTFQDPASGDPAIAIELAGGSIVAFDTVCTHAGWPVSCDSGQRLLVCPCHGAEFDPAHNAQVVAGPAPNPLAPIMCSSGRTASTLPERAPSSLWLGRR